MRCSVRMAAMGVSDIQRDLICVPVSFLSLQQWPDTLSTPESTTSAAVSGAVSVFLPWAGGADTGLGHPALGPYM